MKQLLLDVKTVVDLCVERAGSANAGLAIALAETSGVALWGYAGSVQTLEHGVASEIAAEESYKGEVLTRAAARARARLVMERITAGYQWSEALAGEGPVFDEADPEDAQLHRALDQFADGTAALLTQDRGMLALSLYGQPADMDAINAIAAPHGSLPVIADAAQSFGATYQGERSGNLSTLGCTSFFPSKPLGRYGDGGAIFTSDDRLAQACRGIRVHGQSALCAQPHRRRWPHGYPASRHRAR